ncbi:MAG: metallophosphoesterase [Candidatus Woesearchaeota archaeon]|jgi:Icc-related predicted phosphoesterase
MKVLIFSDVHGSEKALILLEQKAKQAGLLLCLGDFTIFGQHQEKLLKKIDSFGKLCLVIHGNHESAQELADQCKKYKNILFVHKKILRISYLIFLGYGGGGFSLHDKAFETVYSPRFITGIKKYKETIVKEGKKPKVVLLLHGPPFNSKVDAVGDQSSGNKSFRDFYIKQHIDYVFSGHIHEAAGTVAHIKNTTLVNPGPKGIILNL